MSEVTIRPMESGPYIVQGPVRVIDADGNEYDVSDLEVDRALPVRRLGDEKLFCDGTHKNNGFSAPERAVVADG